MRNSVYLIPPSGKRKYARMVVIKVVDGRSPIIRNSKTDGLQEAIDMGDNL